MKVGRRGGKGANFAVGQVSRRCAVNCQVGSDSEGGKGGGGRGGAGDYDETGEKDCADRGSEAGGVSGCRELSHPHHLALLCIMWYAV